MLKAYKVYVYELKLKKMDGSGVLRKFVYRSRKTEKEFKEWFFDYSRLMMSYISEWDNDFKDRYPNPTKDDYELYMESEFTDFWEIKLIDVIECFYTHVINVEGSLSELVNFSRSKESNSKEDAELLTIEEIENIYQNTDNHVFIVGFGAFNKFTINDFKKMLN